MIDGDLKDDIIEEIYLNNNPDWIGTRKPNLDHIDYCAHIDIEIEPKDAKTLDEVKSFTVSQDIMGCHVYEYKRQS